MNYQDLKKGDEFYECECGINIHCRVVSDVVKTAYYDDFLKRENYRYQWKAINVHSGEEIDYLKTEGFEHYGARLYDFPQYVTIKNGEASVELLGMKK